ncbi:MAG: CDP-alcohol phosphatidyltransferase family protein [Allorhizobium sp.]
MTQQPSGQPDGRRIAAILLAEALAILSLVFAAALAGYFFASLHLPIGPGAIVSAAMLLLVIFAIVLRALPQHGQRRFGYANVVTAIRAAIVCIVGGSVFFAQSAYSFDTATWSLVALVVAALALDGVDGYLARRFGHESELGARFDMEVDALLILILSSAAYLLANVGWWVLLIGLMRYGFIAAQYPLARLRAPLPASFRRKLICVVQVGALCIILTPLVAPPLSTAIAAMALALLSYSFAVDTIFLLRRRQDGVSRLTINPV